MRANGWRRKRAASHARLAGDKLPDIQALGGRAARGVLVSHCALMGYWLLHAHGLQASKLDVFNGAAGVDLFFVISGFIIVYASRRWYGQPGGTRAFLGRRFWRVVPVLWLATAVTTAWLWRQGTPLDPVHVGLSFLLVPYSPTGSLDHVVPIVDPAWTLSLEFLFYVIFAACLAGAARTSVVRTSIGLIALLAVGVLLPDRGTPAWLFTWTRPLLLEFVAGMAIAVAHLSGVRLPARVTKPLIAIGLVLLFVPWPNDQHWQGWVRMLYALPPATLVVLAAALSERPVLGLQGLRSLGDWSYSIYIWHMPLLFFMQTAWPHLLPLNAVAFALVGIVGSIAAGWFSYRFVELPAQRFGAACSMR